MKMQVRDRTSSKLQYSMRLLIVTQKIDEQDAVLGFMHGWVAEFARQAESVSVICLEKGEVNLPENARVFSLGKEKTELGIRNYELWKKIKYAWRFVRYIVQTRKEYDTVFVHMNPEYILLGVIFWKWWGKTVTLWYAHKSVTWHLRLALHFVDVVFTSTKSGFRLLSTKVKVIGQGIDTERFMIHDSRFMIQGGAFKIVTVGRITPSKDYDTLIDAVIIVRTNSNLKIHVDIVGPTSVESDEVYLKSLKEKITQKGIGDAVTFLGPVANSKLPEALAGYNLFVNMGHTGSLDKAVPEAMAMGLPVLTCNEAFKEVLGPFRGDLMYAKSNAEALGGKILRLAALSENERRILGGELRAIVVREHSLKSFVSKILSSIQYELPARQSQSNGQ